MKANLLDIGELRFFEQAIGFDNKITFDTGNRRRIKRVEGRLFRSPLATFNSLVKRTR